VPADTDSVLILDSREVAALINVAGVAVDLTDTEADARSFLGAYDLEAVKIQIVEETPRDRAA